MTTFNEPHTYWLGDLAFDCFSGNKDAIAARDRAWRDYLAGHTILVQHKIAPFQYNYLAIPRIMQRKDWKPIEWHGGIPDLTPETNTRRLKALRRAK
jgi:hypothetical protein